ncbi:Acetyltransferase [Legionella busanensis]|uniref:Acetyltransferase n=2 Tax=Legionella busanensis TaxID=190655 RepID=A0A378JIZ5_9GAMM|nr:GNAT family N-acetyltransferase [Legionella busanensis]STX50190.1 Acetyltransferase [Legionella busanensis]
MQKIKITFDEQEVNQTAKEIGENLRKFNESKIGPFEFKPFTLYLADEKDNISAGIKGEIFEQVCMVQMAWVTEKERHKGLGQKLFKKLEEVAHNYDCEFIQLDTAQFQAKPFYEKLGYRIVATLPRNFKSYTTYIMRKYLKYT